VESLIQSGQESQRNQQQSEEEQCLLTAGSLKHCHGSPGRCKLDYGFCRACKHHCHHIYSRKHTGKRKYHGLKEILACLLLAALETRSPYSSWTATASWLALVSEIDAELRHALIVADRRLTRAYWECFFETTRESEGIPTSESQAALGWRRMKPTLGHGIS